jgi:hypothetical protein
MAVGYKILAVDTAQGCFLEDSMNNKKKSYTIAAG